MTADQQYSIEATTITAVYFGRSMTELHREIISSLLLQRSMKFYAMERVVGKFSLQSVEVKK